MLFYVAVFLIVSNTTNISVSCKRFTENKLLTSLTTVRSVAVTLIASVIDSKPTGMRMFLQETSFYGVTLNTVFSESFELKVLHGIMTEGIVSGVVRPLNRTVFPNMEVEQAFRYACHDWVITKMTKQYLQWLQCCCIAFWCNISVSVIVFTVVF